MTAPAHQLILGSFPALESWLSDELAARLRGSAPVPRLLVYTGAGLAGKQLDLRLEAMGIDPRRAHRRTPRGFVGEFLRDLSLPASVPVGGVDALVREVAHAAPAGSYFTPVLDRLGLRDALARGFDDLALGGFLDADTCATALSATARELGDDPAKLTALAALYRAYRAALAGRYTDAAARLDAAIERVQSGAARVPERVYIHGALDLNELEQRLIAALAARTPVTLLLPDDGTAAGRRLVPLRAFAVALGCAVSVAAERGIAGGRLARVRAGWLAPDGIAAETDPTDRTFAIVAAPSEAREVREAVREVVRAIEDGVPAGAIALLFRDGRSYLPLVHETLAAAGVSHYLPAGLPLSGTSVGRAALLLLRLAASERRRADVIELFLTAPLRWGTLLPGADGVDERRHAPAAWERLTRDAGVTAGTEIWLSLIHI